MSALGKAFVGLTGFLLLMAGYIYIFRDMMQPRCTKPFVQIGNRCYFFSSNKPSTYEYYKVSYKNREFSVPVMMGWMHAKFGCETIDQQARLITIQSSEEMKLIVDFFQYGESHIHTHKTFWSGGHRGQLSDRRDVNHSTLVDFYWHDDPHPMKFKNFAPKNPPSRTFDDGFCVFLEVTPQKVVEMGVADCIKKLAFACELDMK
ncbi:uncharacterized protein [Drosophila bipectinata]|uniref:uncharacterized protein n=1 Tax=Drosophila bipectinata TaxID=42026 RepID=UPI001C8AF590|nr:uncharacterized protein LOC108120578 [Drosophila bipectinata]